MPTHLRVAAGVCAVSVGLLVSAPSAIATADSESDGGASHGQSAESANRHASAARGALGGITNAVRTTLQNATRDAVKGVTGTLNSAASSGLHVFPTAKPPRAPSGGTGSKPVSSESDGTPAPEVADVAPQPPPAVQMEAFDPPAVEAPAVEAPAWEAPVVVPDVVAPVSNVLAAVTESVAAAPALVVSLPLSPMPLSDVIASVQGMLTSVTDAGAPLTSLPSDLSALLGVPGLGSGVTVGTGSARLGSTVGLDAPIPTLGSAVMPLATGSGSAGVRPTDEVAGPVSPFRTVSATSAAVTSSETAALAPPGNDSSVLATIEHVIGAFVASVSLAALAAVALPGVGGLLGACAAGIRIGYRQAKAGSALPSTVISRFVGSGPIGVVRSGSQIALHQRVVRVSPRRPAAVGAAPASRSLHLLDHAV